MSAAKRKPRLVIDGRMVGPVPHGFGRYVSGLAAALRRISEGSGLQYEPVFLINRPARGEAVPQAFAGFGTATVGARFLSPLELLEIPRVLKRLGADAYHSPTFSSLWRSPCPWISTVHDLNHLKFGGRAQKVYYQRLLRPFVCGAAAVCTVSEFSRKELSEWSGLPLDRIQVAYNVIDPAFAEKVADSSIEEALARRGLRRGKYFFCLSNLKPHKNLPTLVQGYGQHHSDWDLVLNLEAGALPALPGLKLIGAPDDAEARALMAGAGAVVFPSSYEGFGLPPVEAACMGVPVVLSRIPPHREALADLEQGEALWVDAVDVAAWAKALDRTARGEVIGASIESRSRLMKRFSALHLGVQMDDVYRRVLGLKP